MKIEKIFRNIPFFKNIVLDVILFESQYPVLFTCKNGNDIYLFLCCTVNADKVVWIGTMTDYDTLIALLENQITSRNAFLNVTKEKIVITYNGENVEYRLVQSKDIPEDLLPTAGEYMDADEDEYAEEIAVFKNRSFNVEYVIQPCINSFYMIHYREKSIMLTDEYFVDGESVTEKRYDIGEIQVKKIALA